MIDKVIPSPLGILTSILNMAAGLRDMVLAAKLIKYQDANNNGFSYLSLLANVEWKQKRLGLSQHGFTIQSVL